MLISAAESGNTELFYHVLTRYDQYSFMPNELVFSAIKSGNYDMLYYIFDNLNIEYKIDAHRAESRSRFYNKMCRVALECDNKEMFEYIRQSWQYPLGDTEDVENLIKSAMMSGNLSLVEYVINLSAFDDNTGLFDLTISSLINDNKEAFDYFLSISSLSYLELEPDELLRSSIDSNNVYLFDYVMSLLPKNYNVYWDVLLDHAIAKGGFDMFKHIISSAPKSHTWTLHSSYLFNFFKKNFNYSNYKYLSYSNYKFFFDFIKSVDLFGNPIDWNEFVGLVLEVNELKLFDMIRSSAPTNFNWNF